MNTINGGKLVKNVYVITHVDVDLRSRVHKIVAAYLEGIPHIKAYRISKIDTKEPCIIIARNHYTERLFNKIRRVLQYCATQSCYINSKTDRYNYHFTPRYRGSHMVIVKKDIANNCLLWD